MSTESTTDTAKDAAEKEIIDAAFKPATEVIPEVIKEKKEKPEKAKKEKAVTSPSTSAASIDGELEIAVELEPRPITKPVATKVPGELKQLVQRAIENTSALTIADAEKVFDEATNKNGGVFTPEEISAEISRVLQH